MSFQKEGVLHQFSLINSKINLRPGDSKRSVGDIDRPKQIPQQREGFNGWKFLIVALLLLTITPSALAANDPGHDSLYVLLVGDSYIQGNLNVTSTINASYIRAANLLYGDQLDIRANGSIYNVASRPAIQADSSDLYLDSNGNIHMGTRGGTTGVVQVGPRTGSSITLNISGVIREQGVRVCLANGTNCLSGTNSGNVTSIIAGNGIGVSGATGDVTVSASATTCSGSEYSYWDGDSWECRTDETGGAGSMDDFIVGGDGGVAQTISDGQTLNITGGAGITTTASATDIVSVSVSADSIGDTQLTFNTGQALTAASSPTFAGITTTGNINSTNIVNGSSVQVSGVDVCQSDGTNCPASGTMSSFTVAGDSGSNQTITDGNTIIFDGRNSIATVGAATDTIQIDVVDDSIDGTELADSITLDAAMGITGTSSTDFSVNDTNLYVDFSANRVGILTRVPTTTFTVNGTINATAIKIGQNNVCQSDGTNCPAGASDQNLFETVSGDTGTITATSPTSSFTIGGGTSITTSVATTTVFVDVSDDSIDGTELADSITLDANLAIGGGNITIDGILLNIDITSNQIGIGTATPHALLEIASLSPQIYLNETDGRTFSVRAGSNSFGVRDIAAATIPFQINGGALGDTLVVNNTGKVGIRVAQPSHGLDVLTDGRFQTTGNPGLTIGDGSTGYVLIGGSTISDAGGDLTLDSDTSDVYIPDNLGVGTNSPSSALEIVGNISLSKSAGSDSLGIGIDTPGSGEGVDLEVHASNAYQTTTSGGDVYIYGGLGNGGVDGDVLLGTTQTANRGKVGVGTESPVANFEVDGSVNFTNGNVSVESTYSLCFNTACTARIYYNGSALIIEGN